MVHIQFLKMFSNLISSFGVFLHYILKNSFVIRKTLLQTCLCISILYFSLTGNIIQVGIPNSHLTSRFDDVITLWNHVRELIMTSRSVLVVTFRELKTGRIRNDGR